MARWNRSGRYYGRNRRSNYYNNRRRYSSQSYRASGNMRAAKQQADQSTFTINIPSTISASLKANIWNETDGENNPINCVGVYPMNIYEQLRKSSFYQAYANMYDEFKIDKIKVKLLPTEFTYTATSNGGTYKNITVYTAWDRTGLNDDQVAIVANSFKQSDEFIGGGLGQDANNDGLYCIVGENITTYSSAESRVVNVGTNTSIIRWLAPKTTQEKGQWVSTSCLKEWYKSYDDERCKFNILTGKLTPGTGLKKYKFDGDVELEGEIPAPEVADGETTAQVILSKVSATNKDNPCYLLEDSGFRFKPTLLIGIYPANVSNNCKFNVETEVVCTFRGLRKAKVVAA